VAAGNCERMTKAGCCFRHHCCLADWYHLLGCCQTGCLTDGVATSHVVAYQVKVFDVAANVLADVELGKAFGVVETGTDCTDVHVLVSVHDAGATGTAIDVEEGSVNAFELLSATDLSWMFCRNLVNHQTEACLYRHCLLPVSIHYPKVQVQLLFRLLLVLFRLLLY
jgi:hypothetical protein